MSINDLHEKYIFYNVQNDLTIRKYIFYNGQNDFTMT